MNLWLRGIGDLQEYFGKKPTEVALVDGAVLSDLYAAIDEHWGCSLPSYMWDREKCQFRGPVLCVIDEKAVQDLNAPLKDGAEIRVMRAIAGG